MGKIQDLRPSFFSRLTACAEIFDLSHSVFPRSGVAIVASGMVCLVSLGRGGINNGVEDVGDCLGTGALMVARKIWAERIFGAAKRRGLTEEDEAYL